MTKLFARYIMFISAIVIFSSYLVENHSFATSVPNLPFDNQTYFSDHDFTLTITDKTSASSGVNTIYVLVTSDVDQHQYPLDLVNPVNGIYQSFPINFTTSHSSADSMLKIPTTTNPVIKAYYPSGTFLAQSTIISSNYGTFPSPMSPQPLWSENVYDCTRYGGDSDHDGICDAWENQTNYQGLQIPFLTGLVSGNYQLPCDPKANYSNDPLGDKVCPGNDMPDVYVEVDWLKGHPPDQTALANVVNAFANSPIKTCNAAGTICKSGVRLHIMLGEEIPYHSDTISVPQPALAGGSGVSNPTDFDKIKQAYFGTPAERNVPPGWTY
ncbi:MAG: hypothetical protein KGL95_12020, partial [Patescibacteria group bacterium]|nr:hypothetical protein [Patescibacteria group bacterium]